MQAAKAINTILSFFVEVVMLIALGIAGYELGYTKAMQYVLAIGLPLVVVVIWGIWAAPKSERGLKSPWLTLLKLILYTITTLMLLKTQHTTAALIFGLCSFMNETLAVWFEKG
jgi:hypothetical protein